MDVKDVKEDKTLRLVRNQQNTTGPASSSSRQRGMKALSQLVTQSDSVALEVKADKKSSEILQKRDRVNEVIGRVQEAADAVQDIAGLAESIDGIVARAETGDLSEDQTEILASEANQLVDEIRRRSQRGAEALPGSPSDKIRLEVERSLGKALEALFPDGEDGFGIGTVKLHPPDVIISVRTNVQVARQRIEEIGQTLSGVREEVQEALVAFENSVASLSSVRDLDKAAALAKDAGSQISDAPDKALGSIGRLTAETVELLKS